MVKRTLGVLIAGMFLTATMSQAAGPDFTDLVEEVVPAVVNIESVSFGERPDRQRSGQPPEQDIPDLFRRFFDMPFGEGGPGGRPDRRSGGSGFVIADDGLIITNHHVIEEADEIIVRLADRREFVAELVGSDPASDIALLRIDASDLPVLPLGDSDGLRPGQWVIGVGSPFNFEQSVTAGIVSATGRTQSPQQQYVPFIQTDVAINRGNSGGPLINMDGEVVGINSWILSSHGGNIGLSFSIPVNTARDTVDQLLEFGRVSRGLLGVEIAEVNRQKADALGLDRPRGALINGVRSDSAAERAGVEVGDVILAFDGRAIDLHSELPPAVGATRPGREVELEIWRWGDRMTLTAVLDELEDDGARPDDSDEVTPEPANALGLGVEAITGDRRRQLGDPDGGVMVSSVDSDRAYRAGIRQGDVIQMINNRRVSGMDDFNEIVDEVEAGRSVALLIWRNGNTSFLAYTPEGES